MRNLINLNNSKAIDLIILFHLVSKAATCTDQAVLLGIYRTIWKMFYSYSTFYVINWAHVELSVNMPKTNRYLKNQITY